MRELHLLRKHNSAHDENCIPDSMKPELSLSNFLKTSRSFVGIPSVVAFAFDQRLNKYMRKIMGELGSCQCNILSHEKARAREGYERYR